MFFTKFCPLCNVLCTSIISIPHYLIQQSWAAIKKCSEHFLTQFVKFIFESVLEQHKNRRVPWLAHKMWKPYFIEVSYVFFWIKMICGEGSNTQTNKLNWTRELKITVDDCSFVRFLSNEKCETKREWKHALKDWLKNVEKSKRTQTYNYCWTAGKEKKPTQDVQKRVEKYQAHRI